MVRATFIDEEFEDDMISFPGGMGFIVIKLMNNQTCNCLRGANPAPREREREMRSGNWLFAVGCQCFVS